MEINRISPMVNFGKKEEVKSPKIGKEEVANAGKKVLTGLSCLASFGYYLVANQLANKNKEEIETPTDGSSKPNGSDKPDTPSSDDMGDGKVGGSSKKDDDGDDGINPGYDGKTKVLLALTTDGRCVEIYQLSDGRLISPADYHFPGGRSLSELTFSFDDDSYFGGGYGNGGFGGCSISRVNTSYSRPMETEFASMDDVPDSVAKEMVYKMKITETLGTLEGAEKILEELGLPRNEDVYNSLYSTSDISSSLYEDIVSGKSSDFSVLDLCRRKLMYSFNKKEGTFYEKMQTPLSEEIILKIDERIEEIAEKSSYHSSTQVQQVEGTEVEEYESEIQETEEDYYYQQQEEEQKQYVFA